jgi:hypothetical protein
VVFYADYPIKVLRVLPKRPLKLKVSFAPAVLRITAREVHCAPDLEPFVRKVDSCVRYHFDKIV